ncbi:MAG: hypothetical protein R3F20_08135 [Planctomycetota bacterium]
MTTDLDRDTLDGLDRELARRRAPEPFAPRTGDWCARDLLEGLERADVALDDAEVAELEPFFWFDICAEYDARNLHRHLAAGGVDFSPEFRAFEEAWYRDEMNHYRGFLELYCRLYGADADEVAARVAAREPEFEPIDRFLDDEFRLAALFAYDELATTRAYFVDFELYRRMTDPRLMRFIRLLVRDESFHYQNAVAVLRHRHADRLAELPSVVDEFVRFDLGGHRYRGTFLFDHDWEHIDRDFFRENGEILLSRLAAS